MRMLAVRLAFAVALPIACTAAHKQAPESNVNTERESVTPEAETGTESSAASSPSEASARKESAASRSKAASNSSEASGDEPSTEADPSDAKESAGKPTPSESARPKESTGSDASNTGSSATTTRTSVLTDKDEPGAGKCRESEGQLTLSVDRKTVSLEEGRLQAKMDGPICNLSLRVTNKDGQPILEKAFRYTGPERELRWTPIPRELIEKVEIRIAGDNGAYQSVFLIPWSVAIPHEEVRFDTNKAIIRDSEVASLNDSLDRIKDVLATVESRGLGTVTLFIAGHTDTQGSDEHNLVLSRNRAQAIANWFMKKGLCVPIAFEGFGESALRKLTADNVDEQANRRVDYILSVEPPTIKKGSSPAWKWISKGC